jgi:hypothetical protein
MGGDANQKDKTMGTQMSRAIATAAAVVALSTMSLLPANAAWRDRNHNHEAYRPMHQHPAYGHRDRDEGREYRWAFGHRFFHFHRDWDDR